MSGFRDAGVFSRPVALTDLAPVSTEAGDASGDTEAVGRALLRDGADTLADATLLALLFGLVAPARDPDRLARITLDRFGSYAGLLAADTRALDGHFGGDPHLAAAIRLLHEAALRYARSGLRTRRLLDDRPRLDAYLAAVLGRERVEQFRVLFLDEHGHLLADEAQARGTVNHTPVYPREVVRRAIELDAAALVLVHNHPSGDPTPSDADHVMTGEVIEAAAVFDISVRDHLIVGNGRSFSFADAGLCPSRGSGTHDFSRISGQHPDPFRSELLGREPSRRAAVVGARRSE